MHVVIAKVDETFFNGEAHSLTLPGVEGELTVLSGHMPLVTTLKRGTIVVHDAGGAVLATVPIVDGVLEVRHDSATVIL